MDDPIQLAGSISLVATLVRRTEYPRIQMADFLRLTRDSRKRGNLNLGPLPPIVEAALADLQQAAESAWYWKKDTATQQAAQFAFLVRQRELKSSQLHSWIDRILEEQS